MKIISGFFGGISWGPAYGAVRWFGRRRVAMAKANILEEEFEATLANLGAEALVIFWAGMVVMAIIETGKIFGPEWGEPELILALWWMMLILIVLAARGWVSGRVKKAFANIVKGGVKGTLASIALEVAVFWVVRLGFVELLYWGAVLWPEFREIYSRTWGGAVGIILWLTLRGWIVQGIKKSLSAVQARFGEYLPPYVWGRHG